MLKILSTTVIVSVLIASCGEPEVEKEDPRYQDDRVIAKVGDHILTLGEVHENFRNEGFESPAQEYEEKKKYVEQQIDRFLQIEGAREAGLTYEADSAAIQGFLFQELYRRDADIEPEISDADVRNHFERYGGEIQFGPLIVKDSALIFEIYNHLEKGADWDSLVLQHSIVSLGKKRGGSLGYVPFGQYDEEIQGKAYDLEFGEYTEPFRFRHGWCIVKLFDRIKHSQEDLEENWEIYRLVTTNYAEILQTDEYKEKLRKDYGYRINWDNIDTMIQVADSIKNTGDLPADMPGSAYLERPAFTSRQLDLPIVDFRGGGITIWEYIDFLESYNPYRSPELRDRFEMELALKDIATERIMLDRALELKYDTLETFKKAVKRYEENQMIVEFHKQLFAELDTVTETEIRKYYEEHPEDSYRPEQIRVSAISAKTEQEALEILEKLKMGASLPAMAEKYSVDKKTAAERGDLNFFTEKRYTEIYDAARDIEVGEIGGPVEMYGNYWVFELTYRLERELKPFRLAWSNLRSKLWKEKRENAVQSWVEKKKENTDYFVDLKLLKNDLGVTADSTVQLSAEEESE